MRLTIVRLAIVSAMSATGAARAQSIDRDDYYRHLPPMPRLVSQTAASERFALYGDATAASYRDERPLDGIDDERGVLLHRIATRFSPILRRNNFSVPRFFTSAFDGAAILHVDAWRAGRRVASDSIVLGGAEAVATGRVGDGSAFDLARSDSLLLRLLRETDPRRGAPRTVRAEGDADLVAFFDFPGQDAHSWRAVYRNARDHGTYAHFFVHEDTAAPDSARYTLVVQYWFFYPFNDSNGHGTYPYAGTWQGVGSLGATEQLAGAVVPRLRPGVDADDPELPLERLFEDDHFIAFDASEILLVPDWERIADLVMERQDARWEWSWLLLPLRWGFPASASPGAGAIPHVDVGQIAPEGPAFQPTWNRLAAESGFHVYRPRVLRALFAPLTPWDRLSSGWGFLNIPKTLAGFMPGWSVVLSQLGPWLTVRLEAVGAPPRKVFAPERPPRRLSSIGIGWHRQFGGRGFARLLPDPQDDALAGTLRTSESALPDPTSHFRADGSGVRAWLNLHYGPRFSVQNGFARSRSRLRYTILDDGGAPIGHVDGALDLKEVTGGFRYRIAGLFGDALQPFAGAGWGWTWYAVDHVRVLGSDVRYRRRGGYAVTILPSSRWWPNSWYGSLGIELLAPRSGWLADRLGYGLQLEYAGLTHRLGETRPGRGSLGSVLRHELAIGAMVSW